MPLNTFAELGLTESLLRALAKESLLEPTPIQASAIPHLLAGNDLLGIAQTGTGKTAAFALPLLQHLIGAATRPGPGARNGDVLAIKSACFIGNVQVVVLHGLGTPDFRLFRLRRWRAMERHRAGEF